MKFVVLASTLQCACGLQSLINPTITTTRSNSLKLLENETASHVATMPSGIEVSTINKVASNGAASSTLAFLCIGDWGKGGEDGATMSSYPDSESGSNTRNYSSGNTFDDARNLDDEEGHHGASSVSQDVGTFAEGGENHENHDNNGGEGNKDQHKDEHKDEHKLNQLGVAAAMATYASYAENTPQFVLALGDNFYTKGVQSTTDKLWTYLWSNIYLKYSSLNIPWYAVLGNHDYGYGEQGVQAQVDRTSVDGLWHMDERNYTKTFYIPDGSGTVQIVFIDTTTLAPYVTEMTNEKGGVSSDEVKRRMVGQLTNIDRMLAAAVEVRPTWLLVVGHYPIYSCGDHGDTAYLTQYLDPLLEQYNVDAYFGGHDHISEHLQKKDSDIQYFVMGAGSMTDGLKGNSDATLVWYGINYNAFGVVEATSTTLTVSFVDSDGDTKYTYTTTKEKQEQQANYPTMQPVNRVPHAVFDDVPEEKLPAQEDKKKNKVVQWAKHLLRGKNSLTLSLSMVATMLFLVAVLSYMRTQSAPTKRGRGVVKAKRAAKGGQGLSKSPGKGTPSRTVSPKKAGGGSGSAGASGATKAGHRSSRSSPGPGARTNGRSERERERVRGRNLDPRDVEEGAGLLGLDTNDHEPSRSKRSPHRSSPHRSSASISASVITGSSARRSRSGSRGRSESPLTRAGSRSFEKYSPQRSVEEGRAGGLRDDDSHNSRTPSRRPTGDERSFGQWDRDRDRDRQREPGRTSRRGSEMSTDFLPMASRESVASKMTHGDGVMEERVLRAPAPTTSASSRDHRRLNSC